MSLKVKYHDIPEGAQEAAHVDGQGQPFADMALIPFGADDVAYATLEPDGWPLDGSRISIPSGIQTGFWSLSTSDDSAELIDHPVITLSFPDKYTATGLSITFSPSTDEWCSKIIVTWYSGNDQLCQITAYPDSAYEIIQQAVDGFDKVTVELCETNIAGHFAKVQKIEIGQTHWFDQEEITSVHIVNEVDPSLSELSVDTMQIDIHDRKERSLIPQKNQKVELYQNDKLYAAHYIASSSREAKHYYTLSCQSAIGLLDEDFLGGMFDATPVTYVLSQILEGFTFSLHDDFASSTVTGYLPICTRREALQQLVFAIGAIVTTQESSAIRITPIPTDLSEGFSQSNIFQGAKVELEPRIAKTEVVAHKYTKSSEVETLLDAEEIFGTGVLITFNAPHHSYEVSGGELQQYGANYVIIDADGVVTITGKKYLHSTVRHTKRNPQAIASESNNVFVADDATLVHSGNVADVLQRLYTISLLRQTLTQDAVISTQRAGQIVPAENPWGERMKGYITSMESDLTPFGHTAAVTMLGTKIDKVEEFYGIDH